MIRSNDGSTRFTATAARLGREKKPSVISADSPSLISSVATPSHVTVSGVPASADGTSNRLAKSSRDGRPSLRRMCSPYGGSPQTNPGVAVRQQLRQEESAGVQPTGASIARHPSSPAAGESLTL